MKTMSRHERTTRSVRSLKVLSTLASAAIGVLCGATTVCAAPILGSDLASFTVLGSSTVTNIPTSTIVGNVGVWSSGGANAITGFLSSPGVAVSAPQVTGGNVHAGTTTGTPNAKSAQAQLTTAITNLGTLGAGTLLPADLVGLTLLPGVYTVPEGTTNLSGALNLDCNGNANAAWIFQMPSTLITSPNAAVNMINTNTCAGATGAGVYWNVGSSATIDTNTRFLGNILALASITMNTNATDLCGRALAETGAVTLDNNGLSGSCANVLPGSGALSGGLDVTTTSEGITQVAFLPLELVNGGTLPEPGTLMLLGFGLAGLGFSRRGNK